MKATSKIISVVLILVMCLSVFPVSAFAASNDGYSITGPSTPNTTETTGNDVSPNVFGGTYTGSGAGEGGEEGEGYPINPVTNPSDPITATETKNATAADLVALLNDPTVKEVVLTEDVVLTAPLKVSRSVVLNLGTFTLKIAGGDGTGAAIVADESAVLTVKGSANEEKIGTIVVTNNPAVEASEGVEGSEASGYSQVSSGYVRFNGAKVDFINPPAVENLIGNQAKVESGTFNFEVGNDNLDDNTVPEEQPEKTEETGGDEATIIPDDGTSEEANPVYKFVIKEKTPAEGDNDNPPTGGDNDNPPTGGDNDNPPTDGDNDNPPTDGDNDNPPTDGDNDNPSEGDNNNPPEGADVTNEEPRDVKDPSKNTVDPETRVTAEQQAAMEAATVTIQGEDPVTGSIVIISGVNLPEGLTVEVAPIDGEISGLEEGEEVALAIDITIRKPDGSVYEPWDDPEVKAVDVMIRNKALGNLEDGEAYTLYHVVNDVPTRVNSAEKVEGENAMSFSTTSFSPFVIIKTGVTGSALNGSDGEAHKRSIRIKNLYSDSGIYVNGDPLVFEISGGAAPMAISVVDSDDANSGNVNYYKAGYLLWNQAGGPDYTFYKESDCINPYTPVSTDNCPDPLYVRIDPAALANAPEGKWCFVFWYKDTTTGAITPVYMVQPVTIMNNDEIRGTGPNFDGVDTYDVEKCDYNALNVLLTAELESFQITKGGKVYASYDRNVSKKKMQVRIDGGSLKTVNVGDYFTVGDYYATDAVGHEYIAGQALQIHDSLMKQLPMGEGYSLTVTQRNEKGNPHADSKTFRINLTPGIAVADGLTDYIKGRNTWIKFVACEPIDYDSDGTLAIWIGGQKISHDYYSISNDHKTLWIYRNLLDQLKSNNSYTLTARLWAWGGYDSNGNRIKDTWYPAQASFNILAAGSTSYRSPKTGDESNIALWAAVLVLSGGAVIALVPKKKKNKKT